MMSAGGVQVGRRWRAGLALLALVVLLIGPVIPLELARPRSPGPTPGGPTRLPSEAADQDHYHLPVIERFAEEWPRPDLSHYGSATAPGYHLLLAVLWKATGSKAVLLLVNTAVGLGLVLVVFFGASRYAGGWPGAALTLPLACSPYVLGGSIWITTDNAAWFLAAAALVLAVLMPARAAGLIGAGVLGAGACFVRQIHVWISAPIGAAGFLASPAAAWLPGAIGRMFGGEEGTGRSWGRLVAGGIGALLPLGVVVWLVVLWGGLIPDHEFMRSRHGQGPNPAAPAFALSLLACYGVFFLPLVWGQVRSLRWRDAWVWSAAAAGLLAATVVPTSWEQRDRDFGWLWRGLVKGVGDAGLDVGGRSLVLMALAPAGAALLVLLCRASGDAGRGGRARLLVLSLAGWLAAQSMNTTAWQRYFETPLLIALAWLGAMAWGARGNPRRAWIGPVVLGVLGIGLTAATMYREVARTML